MTRRKTLFQALLDYFPEVELPITLTSDTHHIFSQENKPLPQSIIEAYLLEAGRDSVGEFEEYVACFRLPAADDYIGVVVWKADLMSYEYLLKTFDKRGSLIASQVIAGTKTNGETILKRVATLDEDGIVLVAEGLAATDEESYDPERSRTFQFEISPTGDILHTLSENGC